MLSKFICSTILGFLFLATVVGALYGYVLWIEFVSDRFGFTFFSACLTLSPLITPIAVFVGYALCEAIREWG